VASQPSTAQTHFVKKQHKKNEETNGRYAERTNKQIDHFDKSLKIKYTFSFF
jgi:hypothetical protein